jgi:hypothetical protein
VLGTCEAVHNVDGAGDELADQLSVVVKIVKDGKSKVT